MHIAFKSYIIKQNIANFRFKISRDVCGRFIESLNKSGHLTDAKEKSNLKYLIQKELTRLTVLNWINLTYSAFFYNDYTGRMLPVTLFELARDNI